MNGDVDGGFTAVAVLTHIAQTAKGLASQDWRWDRGSVERSLASLGWIKAKTVWHRDQYERKDGLGASVYHDDGTPEMIEVDVAVFVDVDSLDEIQYDDKVDEFYEAFVRATKEISAVLGEPSFSDGAAARGFPDDQDAVWLSLWNLPTARLMLQQKHEDRELPFRISFVIAPPR